MIESPVWMPIGSRFSIEQTMMQLSFLSRTTSISNSFQPITDSSSSTSPVGDWSRPRAHDLLELLAVVGDAAAAAAERERRPHDRREPDLFLYLPRFLEVVRDAGTRRREPDVLHRVAKQLAVLGHVDGFARGRDELDAVLLEHAFAHEIERAIERRLPAHRRQQRARPFLGDDLGDRAPVNRLDVDGVGARRDRS